MKLTIYYKIRLVYTFIILCTTTAAIAQSSKTNIKVEGNIVSDKGTPVEFATVSLLRAKDSSLVKGTLGNENGNYIFTNISAGTYIIKATAVGYNKGLSQPFTLAASDYTIPVVTLPNITKTLNTVNIQSTKPLIERKIDRTVMNVENSVLAAGNSAMEILERAPGVSIDKDDNISLRGKQGVTVMINDKLTYLSAAQLATLLRSTDGSNIQSIEIITNPSAKYDAAGNSGIINIKLKKNRDTGTSGSLTAGLSYGRYLKDNTSLNLNHKQGKINLFANLSHNDNKGISILDLDRVVRNSGATYFDQQSVFNNANHNNSYRAGADFDFTQNHTAGFVVSGYHNSEKDDNNNNTNIGSRLGGIDSIGKTLSNINQHYNNFSLNLNDRYKIDTLGQELSVDLDYSRFNNNSVAHYDNYFYLPNGQQQHEPLFLRNQTPSTITIHTAKVDYAYPISKTVKLETGIKLSDVKTDNDLQAEIKNASEVFINDTSRTNHFIYKEKVNAAYINLSKTFKNTTIQAGLRAEHTSSEGNLINTGEVVPRKYLDLFPSLFINHTINKKNEIGFNYSRRINRPNYGNLNPFVYYLDQYTYQKGNPFLNPEYTNNFELNYTWNKTINVSLGYSRTNDAITEIILTDTVKKATYQTKLNLQSQNNYSVSVNSPYTINTWWTGDVNFDAFYMGFKSNDLLGGNLNDGQWAYQLRSTQNLTFIKDCRIELTGFYQSPLTYGIFKIRSKYNIDAGLSHSFANKRANIKLSLSDIFNTRVNRVSSMYQTVDLQVVERHESRVARLTFTYNFGNTKIKARQHQTGADAETGRVNKGN